MAFESYILAEDGKTPIKTDLSGMCEWRERCPEAYRVALYESDGVKVSTVFLSHDHAYGGGQPVLWETMIFGGEHSDTQERYTSYEDAVAGHAKCVEMVKASEAQ